MQKGNYAEMKMDYTYESQGFNRISNNRLTSLDAPPHTGIDGVYHSVDPPPKYVIAEAKYGSSRLNTLSDGTPQMSDKWINGGKTQPRLENHR